MEIVKPTGAIYELNLKNDTKYCYAVRLEGQYAVPDYYGEKLQDYAILLTLPMRLCPFVNDVVHVKKQWKRVGQFEETQIPWKPNKTRYVGMKCDEIAVYPAGNMSSVDRKHVQREEIFGLEENCMHALGIDLYVQNEFENTVSPSGLMYGKYRREYSLAKLRKLVLEKVLLYGYDKLPDEILKRIEFIEGEDYV